MKWMNLILVAIRTKAIPAAPTPLEPLGTAYREEMSDALSQMTRALAKYEAYLAVGESIAYSQMLFAEVEVHQERYRNARMMYESVYGDITHYRQCLHDVATWSQKAGQLCFYRHPDQMYPVTQVH